MVEIVHVGIGPLGQMMVRSAASRGGFRIVGAVDTDPAKIGKDLGELCGIEPLGVTISGNLGDAVKGTSARVAVVTTVSSLAAFEPQVVQLAKAKLHVVSTCEELSFPWWIQDASIRRIPFQQKIGAGLTPAAFEAKRKAGTLRHVGLSESMDYIAARLGWKLDRSTESLEPVMADLPAPSWFTEGV